MKFLSSPHAAPKESDALAEVSAPGRKNDLSQLFFLPAFLSKKPFCRFESSFTGSDYFFS